MICTSGYTPEYIERDLPTNGKITFLAKPYLRTGCSKRPELSATTNQRKTTKGTPLPEVRRSSDRQGYFALEWVQKNCGLPLVGPRCCAAGGAAAPPYPMQKPGYGFI